MKETRLPLRLMSAVLAMVSAFVYAQPSWAGTIASYGIGGSWQPVRVAAKNTRLSSVRLVQEEIRVWLPSRRVEIRSLFHNAGAATVVSMELPERGDPGEPGRVPRTGRLTGLKADVDGRGLVLTRYLPQQYLTGDTYDESYRVGWRTQVSFERNQTRTIRTFYTGGAHSEMLGGPESGARQHFAFSLQGASRWHGASPRVRIVFDVKRLDGFSEVAFSLPRARRQGNRMVWSANGANLPAEVDVSWWPGVRRFQIDGQEPLEKCLLLANDRVNGEYQSAYPRLIRGRIWIPLRLLQQWLPAAPDGFDNGVAPGALRNYIGLNWGARNVTAQVGQPDLEASENGQVMGYYTMAAPVFIERGVTMVELVPAVQAVGGYITVRQGVTQLWFGKQPVKERTP